MKTVIILLMTLFLACPAFAGRFNVISYECGEFEENREHIRCAVVSNDGQAWLLIRVLPSARSAKHKKRALYLTDRTIFKFQVMGGVFFTMRTINEKGVAMQRACSAGKGRRFGMACHEWHPVEGGDVFKWP